MVSCSKLLQILNLRTGGRDRIENDRKVLLREASENGHDIQRRELHVEIAPPQTLGRHTLILPYPVPARIIVLEELQGLFQQ